MPGPAVADGRPGLPGGLRLIIAILLGDGAWQLRGARIVEQNNGQLVNNPGPSGAPGFVLVVAFVAVLACWILFAVRQILIGHEAIVDLV